MGIEPILYCLEGSCFVQLSYPRKNKQALPACLVVERKVLELVTQALINDLDGILKVGLVAVVKLRRTEEEAAGRSKDVLCFRKVALVVRGKCSHAAIAQFLKLLSRHISAAAVVLAILRILDEPVMNGVGLAPITNRDANRHSTVNINFVDLKKAENLGIVLVLVVLITRDKLLGGEVHVESHSGEEDDWFLLKVKRDSQESIDQRCELLMHSAQESWCCR